jgi:hypothetical protein
MEQVAMWLQGYTLRDDGAWEFTLVPRPPQYRAPLTKSQSSQQGRSCKRRVRAQLSTASAYRHEHRKTVGRTQAFFVPACAAPWPVARWCSISADTAVAARSCPRL